MARNAHIHTAETRRRSRMVEAAARRGFVASIAAAKQHAQRTGESLADLLDRMDAADPRTCTATSPVLSADHAADPQRGTAQVRARLILNPFSGRALALDGNGPAPLTA